MNKKSIEYIAQKSKELLNGQIESFRSLHQKSGTVIAIASIFAPIFLFLLDKSQDWLKIVAVIFILLLIIGVVILLINLRTKKLYQGFDESLFQDLLNEDIVDVYLYEISYNEKSIEKNDIILNKQNKMYNMGIGLIVFSIIWSLAVLIADTILKVVN